MNRNEKNRVEKIRSRYEEKKVTDMDTLRELDAKVKRPATVFAYVFGSIAAVILGCGMSLIMTDIAAVLGLSVDPMYLGIGIGGVGLVMALLTYPIYSGMLKSRKKRYADEILALSERIMNS